MSENLTPWEHQPQFRILCPNVICIYFGASVKFIHTARVTDKYLIIFNYVSFIARFLGLLSLKDNTIRPSSKNNYTHLAYAMVLY
jgi:hypothetical protein